MPNAVCSRRGWPWLRKGSGSPRPSTIPSARLRRATGVSVVYRRQGDMLRAIPMLERAVGLCQEWHIPLFLPRYTAALGLTYALAGRVAAGLALVEQGMEQAVTRGRPRGLTLVGTWLSEAYL